MNDYRARHQFVPASKPGWEDVCVHPEPDQDNELCGWSRADHMDIPDIHKAGPTTAVQAENGVGYCDVCGQRVHRVPGGQGPTWVHTDTGAVAAPSPKGS